MSEDELARILKERYENAKRNEAALQIHLFGIEFAKEIRAVWFTIAELIEKADMSPGYAAELSKGIKLSDYVMLLWI